MPSASLTSALDRKPILAMIPVLLAMASVTSGASLAKHLFPIIGSVGTSGLRLFFAALLLSAVFRPWRHIPNATNIRIFLGYGITLGLMNLVFYLAIQTIPLGIAVALEFIGPLILGLFHSRHKMDYVWLLCALMGIGLLLPLSNFSGSLDIVGAGYALLAGGFWAGYIYFGQKAGHSLHGGIAVAWGTIIAASCVLPISLATNGLNLFSWNILPLALGIALFASAVPYSLEMVSLKRLPTTTFTILMSMEPAFGALSGWLYWGETLTLMQWSAIACIMVASVGSTLTTKRTPTIPAEITLHE